MLWSKSSQFLQKMPSKGKDASDKSLVLFVVLQWASAALKDEIATELSTV